MKTPLLALLIATNAFAGNHCEGVKPCEKMWSDAQTAVGIVSNMRIRLLTDSRIETFAPNDYGRTGATVTKTPSGDGYDINIQIECYRGTNCDKLSAMGTELFNLYVGQKP